jgi:hypothetical protein
MKALQVRVFKAWTRRTTFGSPPPKLQVTNNNRKLKRKIIKCRREAAVTYFPRIMQLHGYSRGLDSVQTP